MNFRQWSLNKDINDFDTTSAEGLRQVHRFVDGTNITGPDGKKIIATDPALAPVVARMFEWYARGDISLKEAARRAHAAGLLYPKSGAKVPVSTVHTILRNRLYTGWFEWNGKLI